MATGGASDPLVDNSPAPRAIEPPVWGEVVSIPMAGGLYHRYRWVVLSGRSSCPPTRGTVRVMLGISHPTDRSRYERLIDS